MRILLPNTVNTMMPIFRLFILINDISQLSLFITVDIRTVAHHQDAFIVVLSHCQAQLVGLKEVGWFVGYHRLHLYLRNGWKIWKIWYIFIMFEIDPLRKHSIMFALRFNFLPFLANLNNERMPNMKFIFLLYNLLILNFFGQNQYFA